MIPRNYIQIKAHTNAQTHTIHVHGLALSRRREHCNIVICVDVRALFAINKKNGKTKKKSQIYR